MHQVLRVDVATHEPDDNQRRNLRQALWRNDRRLCARVGKQRSGQHQNRKNTEPLHESLSPISAALAAITTCDPRPTGSCVDHSTLRPRADVWPIAWPIAAAKGADRAIHVQADDLAERGTLALAQLLADAIRAESPDLILTGLQSDDLGLGQTGVVLAELLGIPHATI